MLNKVLKKSVLSLMLLTTVLSGATLYKNKYAQAAAAINIWWPTNNATVSGNQPLKANVNGLAIESYNMYWQVDGGDLNIMGNNHTDYPHKETSIDVSGWNWKGSGPYNINFVAKDFSGNMLAQQSTNILISASQPSNAAPAALPPAPTPIQLIQSIQNWWPTDQAAMTGVQPFKAVMPNQNIESYNMYWQVDGGNLNVMNNSYTDGTHKESVVDLSGWNWKGSGPYVLSFVSKDFNGNVLAKTSINIFTGSATSAAPTSTTFIAPTTGPSLTMSNSSNSDPLAGQTLWINPNSDAAQYVKNTNNSPDNRTLMQKLASGAETQWFSKNWISNMTQAVSNYVSQARAAGAIPTMVLYDIPYRDCGNFSSGGANDPNAYKQTVDQFAAGIGSNKAGVILEPDALALTDCLNASQKQQRFDLLKYAVQKLSNLGNTAVYIDIGHPGWLSPADAAQKLSQAGIQNANGFALNISNFNTDTENIAYGQQINDALKSLGVGAKHFVIDSSRNGNGSNGQWCNPWDRALGRQPTTNTGNSMVDAFLWVKGPGGSDGFCNGGPAAGTFWPDYALMLARDAHY